MASTDIAATTRTGARMSESGLMRRLAASLGAGFLILATMVAAAGWLLLRAGDFNYWVDHTYTVVTEIGDFQVLLEQAESARRAYLIAGDPQHQALYDTAARGLAPVVANLRRLTVDNPSEQQRLDRLQPLLASKLAFMHATMDGRRRGGEAAATTAFTRSEDQASLTELRAIASAMTAEERELLAQRSAQATGNTRLLLVVVLLAGLLLGAVAGVSIWVMRRYSRDLERSQGELRRLNEGLEEAVVDRTVELTRANQEIQRFAYIVSHDLRAPLVNIMGFTSELEAASKPLRKLIAEADDRAPGLVAPDARAAVEADLPESIGFIRSSTQKMDRLISAILKLSREGRRVLNPERLDLDALIGGILDATRTQIDARGAEIVIEAPLPDVVSDRVALEQVFSNLIENALKYLQPGRPGRIVIRGRAKGQRAVFEVEDNGRGIAPKDHERIFDLFRRAGLQDQPGEGIGLAHVRAVVHRLNGLIDCVSALDQGAVFRVSLPRVLTREEVEQP